MSQVVLDALIDREDFDVEDDKDCVSGNRIDTIKLEDLKFSSFLYRCLRKPDFQRETNEWDQDRIMKFIKCFIDGDLIPAVILWTKNNSNIFVIDGSHRLSALAAWINDDYGDGVYSRKMYGDLMSDEQKKIAERTRKLIRGEIGEYKTYSCAFDNMSATDPVILKRARNIASLGIRVQWVNGNATKAEESFFNINQQAVTIAPIELELLKSRRKPIGLATRAISKSGKGHKYWSKFEESTQDEIEKISKKIYEYLFLPKYETPIKNISLPVGGRCYTGYKTSTLIHNIISIINGEMNEEYEDETGENTIKCLNKCEKIIRRINTNHISSLGLHPAVYFYSHKGVHKPASLYIMINLIVKFKNDNNLLDKFMRVREYFEEILIKYNYVTQQLVRKKRSAMAGLIENTEFYIDVINALDKSSNKDIDSVMVQLTSLKKYNHIILEENYQNSNSQDISKNTKNAVFLDKSLKKSLKCPICNGYLDPVCISYDHEIAKKKGGKGDFENIQLTHPYCNSIKN